MKASTLTLSFLLPCIGATSAHAQHSFEHKTKDARPNIIFAFGDDYGRYASIYGEIDKDDRISQLIDTPNFDRVAREGVLMTNAYAPAPSSTPCRSSILSGQYFWRTGKGAILQGAEWDESIPSFPLQLEASGYHIGFTYKVWSPGKPADAPYGGARNKYVARGNKWNNFSINVTRSADPEAYVDELLAEVEGNFQDFLDARPEGEPFCYWWGPTNTHRQWQKGSGKELWGIDPDDLKGIMPSFMPDVPQIREDMADYLGECMAFDAGLGVLLDKLEEIGELDNTIVVVSGDHGIPGFPRGKCNLYDLGTKVGMAVRYPPTVAPGRVIEDFVNLMDLAPTFLEFGQTEIPDVMTGRSIKDILESGKGGLIDKSRDHVVTGRERHVAGARHDRLPYPQRAIVTSRYKYIRNFEPTRWPVGTYKASFADFDGGPTKEWLMEHYTDSTYAWHMDLAFGIRPYEELYDLEKDPDETENLVWDKKYQKIRKEMSDRLEKILKENADPRMNPEQCIFETPVFLNLRANYNSPYDAIKDY